MTDLTADYWALLVLGSITMVLVFLIWSENRKAKREESK